MVPIEGTRGTTPLCSAPGPNLRVARDARITEEDQSPSRHRVCDRSARTKQEGRQDEHRPKGETRTRARPAGTRTGRRRENTPHPERRGHAKPPVGSGACAPALLFFRSSDVSRDVARWLDSTTQRTPLMWRQSTPCPAGPARVGSRRRVNPSRGMGRRPARRLTRSGRRRPRVSGNVGT